MSDAPPPSANLKNFDYNRMPAKVMATFFFFFFFLEEHAVLSVFVVMFCNNYASHH